MCGVVGREPKKLAPGTTQKTASAETNAGTQNAKPLDVRSGGAKFIDAIGKKNAAANAGS